MTQPDQPPADGPEEPASATDPDIDAAARIALEQARQIAQEKGLRRAGPGRGLKKASRGEGRWQRGPGMGAGISGPGPSRRDPQPLGGLAQRLMSERGWRGELDVAGVVGRWQDVVGEKVAEHCQVETFNDGALVVRASSTAWATQVRLLLPQLERRLAEEVGEGVVTSIVVLGPGGPSWKHGKRSVRGRGPRDTYG